MRRFLVVLTTGVTLVIAWSTASAAQQTTTIPLSDPADLTAMEWVQSLHDDAAFAGFTVERSVIIVAQVPGRAFETPMPPAVTLVEFVNGRLSQSEFSERSVAATEALRRLSPSVVGLSYDAVADEMTISRQPDPAAYTDLTNEAVEAALVEVFGPSVRGVGQHVDVRWTAIAQQEAASPEVVGEPADPIEVALVCKDARVVEARLRDLGFAQLRGRVAGETFGTEWDWVCSFKPADTTSTDRLIYALLGLVVVLGAVVGWALSARSTLQQQLWVAKNPKSQQAI